MLHRPDLWLFYFSEQWQHSSYNPVGDTEGKWKRYLLIFKSVIFPVWTSILRIDFKTSLKNWTFAVDTPR